MENQRRSALKKVLMAVTGAVGMGFWAKAESPVTRMAGAPSPVSDEKEVFNVVDQDQVPLFSGATKHRGLIFVAGKGAHFEGDIKAHTDHVLKELEKELIAAGSSMEKVLKVSVFLNDIEDYKGMNEVYQGRFGSKPPVRTTVAVAKGGVPGNSLVEMDCIAYH
jgi:2-iminobutanoate/2-iminopropanoate deaminase